MLPMIGLLRFICGWIRVVILILRPGGVKAIAAENMVLRQQLISLSRQHKRSPKLNTLDGSVRNEYIYCYAKPI